MNKIKINEAQANMLSSIGEAKLLKVTKEQYDRILEMEQMKEIDLVSNEGNNFDIIKTNDAYYISNRTTDYSPQDTAYIASVQEIGDDKKKLCMMAAREFETLFEGVGLSEDRRAEYEDMKNNATGRESYSQSCKVNMSEFTSNPTHPISIDFNRQLSGEAKSMEEGGIREMYEEFVNEVYNVNEGSERKYESLIKLMETVGFIENRRIKKELFRNDKAIVEKAVSAGLYEMNRSGSNYKAMEAIEEALNVEPSFVSSKTGKSPEELKAFIDAKRAASNKLVTKNDVERDRMNSKMGYDPESEDVRDEAVDALADGMKGDQQDMKKETIAKIKEEEGRENWKGDDILNHPLLAKLPTDVMKADNKVGVTLPSLDGGHSTSIANHMGHVMDWINQFKSIIKKIPVVDADMKVLNKSYVGRDMDKLKGIANSEKGYGERGFNTDEATTDSGSYVGNGGIVNKKDGEHKSNVVNSIKQTSRDYKDAEIEETSLGGTNGVGGLQANGNSIEYATPGLEANDFMLAGNKENLEEGIGSCDIDEIMNTIINFINNDTKDNIKADGALEYFKHYGKYVARALKSNQIDGLNEDAMTTPQYKGGTILKKVKEKCKKFPYCDEGPGNFDEIKSEDAVVASDTKLYETIAKKTGRSIDEIKEIIEKSIK